MATNPQSIVGFGNDRDPLDYYPTPPNATEALIRNIGSLRGVRVLEPACGDGAMCRVLKKHGAMVLSLDIVDRGYQGTQVTDFLKDFRTERKFEWTITNPPYSTAEEFVRKALSVSKNVAMLLKLQFLEGVNRADLFRENPPAEVIVFRNRIRFRKGGSHSSGQSMMCFAWFIWRSGNKSPHPIIKWETAT